MFCKITECGDVEGVRVGGEVGDVGARVPVMHMNPEIVPLLKGTKEFAMKATTLPPMASLARCRPHAQAPKQHRAIAFWSSLFLLDLSTQNQTQWDPIVYGLCMSP